MELQTRLVGAALCAVLGGAQAAEAGAVRVRATGDPLRDVPAVQAAVDAGGTVVLSGQFEFGDQGRVSIRRNVAIHGEAETRIHGGFWTFFSPQPDAVPPTQPGPEISISGIHFDGALWTPINVTYASRLVVSGNRITHVRPHPYPQAGAPDLQVQHGLLFGTLTVSTDLSNRRYVANSLTGPVIIEDNEIDMTVAEPLRTLAHGVLGMWTTGIEARVARNRVSNVSRNGIEMIDQYRTPDGKGSVRITANTVVTPTTGVPVPTPGTPNGIVVGYFSDPTVGTDATRISAYTVEGNVIETRGEASVGIAVLTDAAVLRNNQISSTGAQSRAIYLGNSNAQIAGNLFRGTGRFAIDLAPFLDVTASGNRITGNDLRHFKTTGAHVLFSARTANNLCAENDGLDKVTDQGSGNRCPQPRGV